MANVVVHEFRVGRVLSRGFGVLFRNIVPFGILAIVFTSPQFIYGLVSVQSLFTEATAGQDTSGLDVILTLLTQLLSLLLVGALVYGTVSELRGRRAGLIECIGRGVALMLPVIGVSILTALAVWLGFVLLIVPGIIVFVMLWVAIPVAVVERPGVFRSLGRSRELTKGSRWRVFGIILVAGAIVFAVVLIFVAIMISIIPSMLANGVSIARIATLGILISWALTAFSAALFAVISAVGYHDLRVVKEGVDAEQIAAVFD